MRVYIVGPTGSGKTYLAKRLSERLKIKHINLDYVFFKHVVDKSRIELPEKEWREKLQSLVKEKNWIIEGVNPINELFKSADRIIYLRPSLYYSLFSQWKRYFTDPIQRKEHGFVNNVKLSKYLVRQYIESVDFNKTNDPKYSRVRKIDEIVKRYRNKVIVLGDRQEVNKFIDNAKTLI